MQSGQMIQNNRKLLALTVLGVCFPAPYVTAQEDKPVRAVLQRRTDGNVASDIAAARAAGLLGNAVTESAADAPPEPKTSGLSITGGQEKTDIEAPKYKVDNGQVDVPEADDAGTTQPRVGSAPSQRSATNAQNSGAIPAGYTILNGIAYSPECLPYTYTDIQCDEVTPTKSDLESPTASDDQWSEEALVKKVASITGGTLQISQKPPSMNRQNERLTSLRPVGRLASLQSDSEANATPSLPLNAPEQSSVQPAAFQDASNIPSLSSGGAFAPPPSSSSTLSAPPSFGSPTTADVLPNSSPSIPNSSLPNSNVVPFSSSTPSSTYDSVPTYQRTAPVVSGAPFVSEGPCQFDASYMVAPVSYSYAADPCNPGYAPMSQPGPLVPVGSYGAVPGFTAPATITPGQAPQLYSSNNSGFRPLFGFAHQEQYNVNIGRGVFGQPKAYVQGQYIRNLLRYIFP